jgi:hypothetical protein
MPTSSELAFRATVKRAALELIMNWMLFFGFDLRLALNFFDSIANCLFCHVLFSAKCGPIAIEFTTGGMLS